MVGRQGIPIHELREFPFLQGRADKTVTIPFCTRRNVADGKSYGKCYIVGLLLVLTDRIVAKCFPIKIFGVYAKFSDVSP